MTLLARETTKVEKSTGLRGADSLDIARLGVTRFGVTRVITLFLIEKQGIEPLTRALHIGKLGKHFIQRVLRDKALVQVPAEDSNIYIQ